MPNGAHFLDNSPGAITILRARMLALLVYAEEVLGGGPGYEKVTVQSALAVVQTLIGPSVPTRMVHDARRAIDAHDGERLLGEVIRIVQAEERDDA